MSNRKKKSLKINTPLEEVTSNLPCEIIENILSRLPVKSLLKFKSVSKPWYSLISDSKFARVHLQQSMNSDYKSIMLYFHVESQKLKFLKLTNQNFRIETLEFPLKKYREAKVLCSCDGLILLKTPHRWDKMFVLWNPATRTYTKFSCPFKITLSWSNFGLCYHASNDDYKVVYINGHHGIEYMSICYAVFSYKNNSWIVEKDSGPVGWISSDPGLFVNGALHWVKYEKRNELDSNSEEGRRLQHIHDSGSDSSSDSGSDSDSGSGNYANDLAYRCNYDYAYEICCFDPRDDKFKKLSKPACFDISSIFSLTALRGQLSLCRNTNNVEMVEIWMMKEYGDCNSWTKLLTIENVPVHRNVHVYRSSYYVKPMCWTYEGNYVLYIFESGIAIYSPKDNKFDEILVCDDENPNCPEENMIMYPSLVCWNDSLLLPNRINRTKRKQVGNKN